MNDFSRHDLLYSFAHQFLPNMTLKGSPDMADLLSESCRLDSNEPFRKVFYEVIDKSNEVEIASDEFKVKEYFREGVSDIYIIKFPKPEYPTGALYVAVVDSEYMQYFTFELMQEGGYAIGSYYLNKDEKVTRRFFGYKGKPTMDAFYESILTKLEDNTSVIQKAQEEFENKPKIRSIWSEWQFFLMFFLYLVSNSFFRGAILGITSTRPGLLHLFLVFEVYEKFWHEDKKVTFKKLVLTLLWLIIGNLGLLVLGVLLGSFFNLIGIIF